MPSLLQLMRSQDLGYVRIVAGLWGLDQMPGDMEAGLEAVVTAMCREQLVAEVVESLDLAARGALIALARGSGRMPWDAFARQFGEIREMGAGRREREQPQLHPVSAAEMLFYRGMLGRAFFETDDGLREFAYIPDDLLQRMSLPPGDSVTIAAPGRAATPAEHAGVQPAGDLILDEATTLLAALRAGMPVEPDPVLQGLLECAGVTQEGAPQAERVRTFLEAPRAEALSMLVDGWRNCQSFNELRLVPGLICEGPWSNQPRATRAFVLQQLGAVPPHTWWNLRTFIESIKLGRPDFQRPAGDFDSWFIRRAVDGEYLRGFGSWDEVDGGLIRFILTEVMRRLGLIDIGGSGNAGEPRSFRRAAHHGQAHSEDGHLNIGSQGRISAGRNVPRAVRYQLARFCEWEQQGPDEYRFRVTPRSMEAAAKQGLRVEHLLTLLARHGKVPPALMRALQRWEANGTEAHAETQLVLRVRTPEMLKKLRASKAARFLGEPLGPTSIVVKAGALRKVAEAMTELGVLLEDRTVGPS